MDQDVANLGRCFHAFHRYAAPFRHMAERDLHRYPCIIRGGTGLRLLVDRV